VGAASPFLEYTSGLYPLTTCKFKDFFRCLQCVQTLLRVSAMCSNSSSGVCNVFKLFFGCLQCVQRLLRVSATCPKTSSCLQRVQRLRARCLVSIIPGLKPTQPIQASQASWTHASPPPTSSYHGCTHTHTRHRRATALRCDSSHAPPPPPPLTALLHARSCTLPLLPSRAAPPAPPLTALLHAALPARSCCHLARHNLVSPLCPPPTLRRRSYTSLE